jgi:rSAM/selenodomain-associated transferase 1
MSRHSGTVLVMAKAPRPGHAKTRLHPLLGLDGSARLQAALIRRTALLTTGQGLRTYLAFDPPDARAELAALVPDSVRLLPQPGGNLGQRLTAAVSQVTTERPGPLLVIGTDAPTLTGELLTSAFTALHRGADVVLGPALDGGYYLIGLHRPQPALFGIDPGLWGGEQVLAATLDAATSDELSVRLLPPLRDLDTPEDATALLADPALPTSVAALLTPAAPVRAL